MAKTALIIGGTKGLGLSLAWEAHKRGIQPIIAGSSVGSPRVREKFPPDSRYFVLDLADQASVEQIVHRRIEPIDYVFWVSGVLCRMPLDQMSSGTIDDMIDVNLSGPVRVLQLIHFGLHYLVKKPYHFITIASTSSWRLRDNETLYCALKAAQAHFTRNFAGELARDLPGSKVTLVNPGGIKTGLFKDTDQDISNFMKPDAVARAVWSEVERQQELFQEVQIMRNDDGSFYVTFGPRMPEMPFGETKIPEDLKDEGVLSEEHSNRIRETLGDDFEL